MPDEQWISHTARLGDRWDALAAHYYGDPYGYMRLVAYNTHIPIRPFIAPGTLVAIPLVEPDADDQVLDLPPWKR